MQKNLAEICQGLDTDKTQSFGYISNYERYLDHLRNMPVRLLEIGVLHGGSLLMWREYFPKGLIVGLDFQQNPFKEMPDRVRFYRGSQDDEALLDLIAQECAPDGFDIVIDDAAHIGTLARASFRNLFEKHLKSGGLYVIEDWGTGYWASWSDGKAYQRAREDSAAKCNESTSLKGRLASWLGWNKSSPSVPVFDPNFPVHNFGMVGFVKGLVDEVAWPDITHHERGNSNLSPRTSMIREITVYNGQVFVVKA